MVKVGLIKIERDGKGGNGIQKDTRNLQAGILHNSIYKQMSLQNEFTWCFLYHSFRRYLQPTFPHLSLTLSIKIKEIGSKDHWSS